VILKVYFEPGLAVLSDEAKQDLRNLARKAAGLLALAHLLEGGSLEDYVEAARSRALQAFGEL